MTRSTFLDKAALVLGAAPLALVAVAAASGAPGWLPFDVAFGLLTLKVAPVLAWLGLAVGLAALALWLKDRCRGGRTRAFLVLTGTLAPLGVLAALQVAQIRAHALPPIHETATDWSEPLRITTWRDADAWPLEDDPRVPADVGQAYAGWTPYAGRRVAEINAEACPGARTVPRLVPTDEVVAALKAEGVRISGSAPWRVEGSQASGWYGRERDVVVRMEPGATDIRVSERYGLSDLGETCGLVTRLVGRLQAGR